MQFTLHSVVEEKVKMGGGCFMDNGIHITGSAYMSKWLDLLNYIDLL